MKVAIVTGGSRGLGKAVVDGFQTKGWSVIEFSRSGNSAMHIDTDMSKPEQFIDKFHEILDSFELIDEVALISNAGLLQPIKRVGAMATEDLITSFNVNIVSALTMIQAFVEKFRSYPGRKSIISISSGAATKGYPGWSLYCAGKAACENYLCSLWMEEALEEYPFQVISFNPGVMDTSMQNEIREADPEQFPMLQRFINLKRDGDLRDPRDVAEKLINIIEYGYENKRFIYSVNE